MPLILSRRSVLAIAAAIGVGGATGVTSATRAEAANNNTTAWNFFRAKGLTAAQTAGLIGNFIVESGADPINPASRQVGGPGRGIAQWEGPRRASLERYATARGLPWSNLQLQLDFVWREFAGPEAGAFQKLRETSTPESAAIAVRRWYERPSVNHDQARINAARLIYSRYVDGKPPTGNTTFPSLRQGAKGSAVRTLQYKLRSRGHTIATDGSFGPQTLAQVRAFQRNRGLVVDGWVGPQTWMAVLVTVKQGARGDAVRALQAELRDAGYNLAVDGDFGSVTNGAVRRYQADKGLPVDGRVGPITWGSLVD